MGPQDDQQASLLIIGFGSLLTMLFSGFPATFSGLMASGIILVLATILPDTRLNYQNWFTLVVDSGRDGLSVLLSCSHRYRDRRDHVDRVGHQT